MSTGNIGYASLQVIPSMRGVDARMRQELGGIMPGIGQQAGDQLGGGMAASLRQHTAAAAQFTANTFAAMTASATAFTAVSIGKGWDRLTTIKDSTAALEISLGSATEAASLLDATLDVVSGTSFNLDQFAGAAQRMTGFGIAAERIPYYLTAIGEASATQGRRANEYADRLSTVFGQVAASGQLALNDVWRISDTGVSALAILGNHFGVTTDEMKKMVSQGAVPAGEALDVLAAGILDGSNGINGATVALAGTMETLREGLAGSVAGISPAMARFGAALLEPFSPLIVAGARSLADSIDVLATRSSRLASSWGSSDWAGQIVTLFERLPSGVDATLDGLGDIAPMAGGAGAALLAMSSNSLRSFLPFLPAANPIVAGLAAITMASPEARAALGEVAGTVIPLVADVAHSLLPALRDLSEMAGVVLPPAIHLLGGGLEGALSVAIPLADAVSTVTGVLGGHEWIVLAAASAWGALKLQTITAPMWSTMSTAIAGTTGQIAGMTGGVNALRGAIAGINPATLGLTAAIGGVMLIDHYTRQWTSDGQEDAAEWLARQRPDDESVLGLSEVAAGRFAAYDAIVDEIESMQNQPHDAWGNLLDWRGSRRRRARFDALQAERGPAITSAHTLSTAADRLGLAGMDDKAIQDAANALGVDLIPALEAGEISVLDLANANAQLAYEQERGHASALQHADGVQALASAAATAEERVEALFSVLDANVGKTLSIFDAETDLEGSRSTLAGLWKETGLAMDATTEAGRKQRDAFSDAYQAQINYAKMLGEAGREDEMLWVLGTIEADIIKIGQSAGIEEAALRDFLGSAELAQADINPTLELWGVEAAETELDELTKDRTVTVFVRMAMGLPEDRLRHSVAEMIGRSMGGSRTGPISVGDAIYGHRRRWGGIDQTGDAHITDRELFRYGEPETGSEAWIPRLGDRNRSIGITREVASWFGLALVDPKRMTPMAVGGVRGTSPMVSRMADVTGGNGGTSVEFSGDIRLDGKDAPEDALEMVESMRTAMWLRPVGGGPE